MNERQRQDLIALGRLALAEIQDDPFAVHETSLVFEDAFRELAPERTYLADYLAQQRGYSGEALHIRHALAYLASLPLESAVTRAWSRIEPLLDRAWKHHLFSRQDERGYPFLLHPENHIRHAVTRAASFTLETPSVRRLAQHGATSAIGEGGFNLYRRSDAVLLLGERRGRAVWRLIERMGAIAAEEARRAL